MRFFFKTAFFRVYSPTTLFTTMPRLLGTPRPPLGKVSLGTRNRVVRARNYGIIYTIIREQENLELLTYRRIFKNTLNVTVGTVGGQQEGSQYSRVGSTKGWQ